MLHAILDRLEASPHRAYVKKAAQVAFWIFGPVLRLLPGKNRCPVCDARLVVLRRIVISDELADAWRLSPEVKADFDNREGEICIACGASLRVRHLASAIIDWLHEKTPPQRSLRSAASQFACYGFKVAELNACGELHSVLQRIPELAYSEYRPAAPDIRHEDLLCLSYPDNYFDLVLHSDTLEHVPDVQAALKEIFRVLKPGGSTIFTIPVVNDGRLTVVRAALVHEQVVHLKPPSYHGGSLQRTQQYLVFYEFGSDFLSMLTACGFKPKLSIHPSNSAVVAFTATKPSLSPQGASR